MLAPKSSTRTVAVAFEVPPVIVSPTANLPSLPAPASRTILFPSTSRTLDAVSNSKQWFGRKMSKEVAEAMMYPILKYPKLKDGSGELNYDKEPSFRVKLPCYDNQFSVEILTNLAPRSVMDSKLSVGITCLFILLFRVMCL